jgi:hypothetical protein
MTVNALAFYAIAVLIVLAAAAAVGLPSLRLAGYAGAAVVVLLAILDLVSGADTLAVIQIVVPGIAAGVVFLVLRREQYQGLGTSSGDGTRWRIAGPVALAAAVVLVVTVALVANGWFPGDIGIDLIGFSHAALLTVLHYRTPYALVIAVVAMLVTVGAGLVIGRRSADEQTLDQHLAAKRDREERARRRRDDREQGRRRAAKVDS